MLSEEYTQNKNVAKLLMQIIYWSKTANIKITKLMKLLESNQHTEATRNTFELFGWYNAPNQYHDLQKLNILRKFPCGMNYAKYSIFF